MVPLQNVFCASTTQPKVTPTNNHLLINIHNIMFSLGHQGLPISPKALRNLLQAYHKKEFADMVKEEEEEEEEEEKFKVPHKVKNEVFPTVA